MHLHELLMWTNDAQINCMMSASYGVNLLILVETMKINITTQMGSRTPQRLRPHFAKKSFEGPQKIDAGTRAFIVRKIWIMRILQIHKETKTKSYQCQFRRKYLVYLGLCRLYNVKMNGEPILDRASISSY